MGVTRVTTVSAVIMFDLFFLLLHLTLNADRFRTLKCNIHYRKMPPESREAPSWQSGTTTIIRTTLTRNAWSVLARPLLLIGIGPQALGAALAFAVLDKVLRLFPTRFV